MQLGLLDPKIAMDELSFRTGNAFVSEKVRGIAHAQDMLDAVIDGSGKVRGVCTVDKPVARALNDGYTVEVTRVATDGARNACSMLLGGARRAAFALGYAKIVTYTLSIEGGASLRGAGWTREADVKGRSWSCPSRPRDDKHPLIDKVRWSATRDRPKPVIDWGGDA